MTDDFPTPDSPVKKHGFSIANKVSRANVYFVVSVVGTIKSKYGKSLS